MFGSIGGAELVLVLVLALLLFGPRKLPQIGQKLGDALAQFRKATHEFKTTLQSEVAMEEIRETRRELTSAVDEIRSPGLARGSPAAGSEPSPDPGSSDDSGVDSVGRAEGEQPPSVPVTDAGGRRED